VPQAKVGEVDLEYEILGPDAGEALLLIGGLGSQLVSWDDEFCQALVARGYRVIRYDNRDSGLSSSLDELGVPDLLGLAVGGAEPPYLLEDLARDAAGLLEHLGVEHAHVLGLSLGGMVGQILALERPDLVLSLVAVLSGPPGRPARLPEPAVLRALLRPPVDEPAGRVEAAVELRRALAGAGDGFNADHARRRAEVQIKRAHRPAGTMRQAAAVLATPNRLAELDRLTVPTLLVHGELDPLIPFESARAAAEAIPDSRFIAVPQLGHDLPPSVAFELIGWMVEFHRSHDGATPRPA
jgi:pimeloyl-ACP methyl ester carboxylesterase